MSAVKSGSKDIVKLLIAKKADINAKYQDPILGLEYTALSYVPLEFTTDPLTQQVSEAKYKDSELAELLTPKAEQAE